MHTVIFGGAGFVGLNIAERLLDRGERVTIFDAGPVPADATEHFATLGDEMRAVIGDVRDEASVQAAFSDPVTTVIYGAAITARAERDRTEPERIIDVNLGGFVRALRAARDAGVRRVINLSSSAAYGDPPFAGDRLSEDDAADPVSLYALSKFATERAGRRLGDLWDMDVRSVRLSGVFGRWERQTGVRDTPSPHHQVMAAALEGRPALLSRRDRRDWIYAPDAAAAIVSLIDAETLNHPLYNVSNGTPSSVLEFGEALAALRPGFECRLARDGETATVDLHVGTDRPPLDIGRLRGDTGFDPCFPIGQAAQDYDQWIGSHSGYAN